MSDKIYLILQNQDGSRGSVMAGHDSPEDAVLEGLNLVEDNAAGVDPVHFDEAFVFKTDEDPEQLVNGSVVFSKPPKVYWTPYGWSDRPHDWSAWMESAHENMRFDARELRGELHDPGNF